MLLVCQTTLSVLGIGESPDLWDEESDSNSLSNSEATCDNDRVPLLLIPDQLLVDGRTTKRAMVSVRALGTAITFFGLTGIAAEASHFSQLPAFGIAILAAFLTFMIVSVLFRLTAFQPYRTETRKRFDDSLNQDVNQNNDDFSHIETRD